jgi:plastocyanin
MTGRVLTFAATAAVALTAGTASATAPPPARLMVTAHEFRLVMSRGAVDAGPAIVQLVNAGEDSHDLALRRLGRRGRPAGRTLRLPETTPEALSERRLSLRPGRYRLWCTLPGHDAAGMRARLVVR